MILRKLGSSDLEISPLGLGTWAIGGDGVFGWGPQDDAASVKAIHRAVELGINWIDTAAFYGMGHSEEVVAAAVKELGSSRKPYVFTKCGLTWDADKNVSHCLKAGSVRAEIEASLRRLQCEVIDLYQIHWPALPAGAEAPDLEEAWTTLDSLVQEGKVRAIGVSNFDVPQLRRVQPIAPVASLQPPYSALMREIEDEILPFCFDQGIGVIVYSPLHNGLLTGAMTRERIAALPESDWRKQGLVAFEEPHLTRSLALVEVLRAVAGRHERTVAEVAIAWTLRHPAVTGAIVGARSPGQVDGFRGALDFRLSDEDSAEIAAALPESMPWMKQ